VGVNSPTTVNINAGIARNVPRMKTTPNAVRKRQERAATATPSPTGPHEKRGRTDDDVFTDGVAYGLSAGGAVNVLLVRPTSVLSDNMSHNHRFVRHELN